jgi:hypothetical protein
MKTKTVEFTENRTVEDAKGNTIATFEAGKRYDLNDTSADRWIRRGVAFDVKAKEPAEAPKSDAAKPK